MSLSFWQVEIRRECKTGDLYEELKPKLSKRHSRAQIVQELNRVARERRNFEVGTDEGLWIASPMGKTTTGFYLWKLIFRPSAQTVA